MAPPPSAPRVAVGIEALRDSGYAAIADKRVAALVHSASAFPDTLIHTVDALAAAQGVQLEAILAPEHGFRGDRQAEHGDPKPYIDADTGIWVHSVYRKNTSTLQALLRELRTQVVLVDIQDAGTRLYTFVWTLYSLMQAASLMAQPPAFLIADRPNPLGGLAVEGPVLNTSCCASRYGLAAVPHRHGLTVGELARLFGAKLARAAPAARALNVTVLRMRRWRRAQLFDDTGLPWLPPSPNLPTAASALAYAATVFVEATTASEGRGTTTPFQTIGAPFLNASQLVRRLAAAPVGHEHQTGGAARVARWRKEYFIPTFFKWNGSVCAGARLVRAPTAPGASLFREGVHVLAAVRALASPPTAFAWDGRWFGQPGPVLIDRYAGTPRLRQLLDDPTAGGPDAVADAFEKEARVFATVTRAPFLLYT